MAGKASVQRTRRGLESMKERVELSGGSFTIGSSKTKGTTIKAVWLLSEYSAGEADN